MATEFVKCYENGLTFGFGHYEKFLAICPDDAWQAKAGGWTLAQQYYHGLMATAGLLQSVAVAEIENPNPEAGKLMESPTTMPTKAEAAQFLANIREAAALMFQNLSDAALLQKNEFVSQKFGREISNAEVLELIPCHMLYHLGSCDAGLRDRNLPGAW